VYSDRSFTFIMKTPPASVLIRKALGLEKGSGTPNTAKVGRITRQQLEEIAKTKTPDLTAATSTRPCARSRAAPAAWASTWRGSDMVAVAKRMKPWSEKIDSARLYPIDEALALVKQFANAKFDESIDVAVNLGIDASKSDQQVRGSTVLPARHGQGRPRRGVHVGQERRRGP